MKIKDKREKYVRKIMDEFTSKGWDLKRLFGRAGINRFTKNEQSYNEFKNRVRKERSYYREREKVHAEYSKIQERLNKTFELKTKSRTKDMQKMLFETFGATKQTKRIWQDRVSLGLTYSDFMNPKKLKEKVANKYTEKFFKDITEEINYSKDGQEKRIGSVFKNVSDEDYLKPYFKEIEMALKGADDIPDITTRAIDYLYGTIIMNKYEGANAEYSEFKRGRDEPKFWKEVAFELTQYIKSIK